MKKAISLIELIVAIALIGALTIAFFSLHLFGTDQQKSSTRQTILQNEASHVLEHMTKTINEATGNTKDPNDQPVTVYSGMSYTTAAPDSKTYGYGIKIHIKNLTTDTWVAYRQETNTNQISYYSDATANPPAGTPQVLSNKIRPTSATTTQLSKAGLSIGPLPIADNNLPVTIIACWYPDEICPGNLNCACGTIDNPSVTMHTNIKMPGVSSN